MKYTPLLPGQKFNKLKIISLHHKRLYINPKTNKKKYKEFYLCKCDCGNEIVVYKDNLKRNHTTSCGCYKNEMRIKSHTKHGMEGSRIYKIWQGIKKRCYRKSFSKYNCYGGRGITVCNEWKNDFMSFYKWAMANGYKDNLSIDRIDVNGNYEPSNCRWATQKEQMRNTRRNKFIEYGGKVHCVSEWAEILGINPEKLFYRLYNVWPIKKLFNK